MVNSYKDFRIAAFLLAISLSLVNSKSISRNAPLELIILHNNDMHARFEQTGANSNTCSKDDITNNKCYGGLARVGYELKKFRSEANNGGVPVLYLNAGDTYTGTPWFSLYKDKIVSSFLNLLKPDANSLGNHEFDKGVEGLVPFLNDAHFPVLAANLDLTNTPEMANTTSLKKSTVFTRDPDVLALLETYRPGLDSLYAEVIGVTKNKTTIATGIVDLDSTIDYIKSMKVVYPSVEWRITLNGAVQDDDDETYTTRAPSNARHLNASFMLIASVLILYLYENM